MQPNELHRGRLIDHIQRVVPDLSAARRFYEAERSAASVRIRF